MNGRSVLLHGLLLAAALVLAWTTFSAGDVQERAQGSGVVLVEAAVGDVERIRYEGPAHTVVIDAREDAAGRWYRGTVTEAGRDHADPFQGGLNVDAMWLHSEPLEARRVLSAVDDSKLAELGLDDARATLTVTARGKDHRFALGGTAFGTADAYARTEDGRYVVLPAELIRPLTNGIAQLRDARLLVARRPAVETLALTVGGKTLELRQHDRAAYRRAFWAVAGEDSGRDELKVWVDRLLAMSAQGHGDVEVPEPSWRQALQVTLRPHGEAPETLKLYELPSSEGAQWRVLSSHARLAAVVAPSLADALAKDAAALIP